MNTYVCLYLRLSHSLSSSCFSSPFFSFLLFCLMSGFPLRKAAYQTLDTLLDAPTLVTRSGAGHTITIDVAQILTHLTPGFTDHDDIIILVYQMIEKCAARYPQQLASVLDTMPGKMMVTKQNSAMTQRRGATVSNTRAFGRWFGTPLTECHLRVRVCPMVSFRCLGRCER